MIGSDEIVSSQLHTKQWRNARAWYAGGKRNECEKYQMRVISKWFNAIEKTHDRIDLRSGEIQCLPCPFKRSNAFEWSENFDGKTTHHGKTVYFNFKFVVGSGGAQTRSLREVYHFIKNQNGHIFVNILDCDESYKRYIHMRHMMSPTRYIGDTYNFPAWYVIAFILDISDPIKNIIMKFCF